MNKLNMQFKSIHFRVSEALYEEMKKRRLFRNLDETLNQLIIDHLIGDNE